jgi:hypothetical protein
MLRNPEIPSISSKGRKEIEYTKTALRAEEMHGWPEVHTYAISSFYYMRLISYLKLSNNFGYDVVMKN